MAIGAPSHSARASADFVAEIDAQLRRLLEAERERWLRVDSRVAPVLDTLADLVFSGGKRLRPLFAYWAFVGAGGRPDSRLIVDAGAALEMLHLAALIHDDVIDESPQRRGLATAHVRFADLHRELGWRGDGRHFGEGIAILLGDFALFHAERLMAAATREARDLFSELRLEMTFGQYLDLAVSAEGHVDPETATRIALYKSAKYSVERPLQIGAAQASGINRLFPALSAYGLPLGMAFQLVDDLLGVFGDPVITGKPVRDDLRQGKPTLLMALSLPYLRSVDPELLRRYERSELGDADARRIQAVLEEGGRRHAIERMVDSLVAEAVAAIERAPLTAEARDALVGLAEVVKSRLC